MCVFKLFRQTTVDNGVVSESPSPPRLTNNVIKQSFKESDNCRIVPVSVSHQCSLSFVATLLECHGIEERTVKYIVPRGSDRMARNE